MNQAQTAKHRLLAQAERDYQPELVAIDAEAIARLPIRTDRFNHLTVGLSGQPAGRTPEGAAAYSIVLNSLNFMFWTPTPQGMARYHWRDEGGAHGLKVALDHIWGEEATPVRVRERLAAPRVPMRGRHFPGAARAQSCAKSCRTLMRARS